MTITTMFKRIEDVQSINHYSDILLKLDRAVFFILFNTFRKIGDLNNSLHFVNLELEVKILGLMVTFIVLEEPPHQKIPEISLANQNCNSQEKSRNSNHLEVA